MARLVYDASDVESGGGGNQPEPAMYDGKIAGITERKKKTDGSPCHDLEVVVDVGQEYARLWTYIPLLKDATNKWKLREFTDALGLPPKGSFPDFKTLVNKPVLVKVVADTDRDGEYRGRIKNLFAPGTKSANGASASAAEVEEVDYSEWTDEDLKEELAAREITLTGRYSNKKAVDALQEDDAGEEPEDEPEDEEPDEEPEGNSKLLEGIDDEIIAELKADPDHYEDWSDEDLKEFVNDLGIAGNVSGRKSRTKLVEAITSFAAEAVGGSANGTEPDDEAETDTYDDTGTWPNEDLKAEIEERNEQGASIEIVGRWTRPKMIAALREDNANAEKEPF